jgi:hypothetical protein
MQRRSRVERSDRRFQASLKQRRYRIASAARRSNPITVRRRELSAVWLVETKPNAPAENTPAIIVGTEASLTRTMPLI